MIYILKRVLSGVYLAYCLFVFAVVMMLVLPFILLSSIFFKNKQGQEIAFYFLRFWARTVTFLSGFSVNTLNSTSLDQACIYVCNHNSYFDAIAVVLAIPESFKPLGKIEMTRVPIFGMIYRRVVVLINRDDKESRRICVEKLKTEIEKGQSILVFPEGTMNRSSKPLAEFYDGAFRLAMETQCPIKPLVILNARNLFPRSSPLNIRPGRVTCVFDALVFPGENEDVATLKERVRIRMEKMIENLPNT